MRQRIGYTEHSVSEQAALIHQAYVPLQGKPTRSSAGKGYTLVFPGMERGVWSLFCFKSALGTLEMLSPSSFVCACICAGSGRGAYGRSDSPLTVPLFLAGTGLFLAERAQSQPLLHITSCAPCLLALSSLPECLSFVVFWLIGRSFNYCWTEQTSNFYLPCCWPSDHGLQAGNRGLGLFRLGVNCSGFHGVSLIYAFSGEKHPSMEEKAP